MGECHHHHLAPVFNTESNQQYMLSIYSIQSTIMSIAQCINGASVCPQMCPYVSLPPVPKSPVSEDIPQLSCLPQARPQWPGLLLCGSSNPSGTGSQQ